MRSNNINNSTDHIDHSHQAEITRLPYATSDISNSGNAQTQTTATFEDSGGSISQALTPSYNPVDVLAGHEGGDIAKFLARPTLIHKSSWIHTTVFDVTLTPYRALIQNALIAKKVANYQLFRGDLKLKVMLNGTPFHMGRLLAAYEPGGNDMKYLIESDQQRVQRLSQAPGTRDHPMAPNKSDTFELTIPFFYPFNYINVVDFRGGVGGDTDEPGRFTLLSPTILRTANGNVVDAQVSVYAWFENVELLVPTATSSVSKSATAGAEALVKSALSDITADNSEYYPDGAVSSITSAFANAAGALKGVPYIGPFAQSGESALNIAGNVARFFGFSKPPVVTDTIYVKNRPFSSITHLYGNETVEKLTFDPKQGITVDPRTVGLESADQMTVSHISTTWSHFAQFDWTMLRVANDTLFEFLVTPAYGLTVGNNYNFTALGFAAYPFEYWSGTIEYKLVFSTSQYHSGRVSVTFDPNGTTHAAETSNQQYIEYVDISNQDEIYFSVSWAQGVPYKLSPGIFKGYDPVGVVYNFGNSNGSINISVVNPLISPEITSDVTILVYCRAGSDFELMAPNDRFCTELTPYATSMVTLVGEPNDAVAGLKSSVYFGEKVVSFRALVKRYTLYRGITSVPVVSASIQRLAMGGFPAPRSTIVPAGEQTWNVIPNNVYTPLMTFLRPAYAGYRGGIRWKVVSVVAGTSTNIATMTAFRDPEQLPGGFVPRATIQLTFNTTGGISNITELNNCFNGAAITAVFNQPVLEYEVPFFAPSKFGWSYKDSFMPNNVLRNFSQTQNALTSTVEVLTSGNAAQSCLMMVYVAAADDFDLVWFICAPTYRIL